MLFLCVILGVCLATDVINSLRGVGILRLGLGYYWCVELLLSVGLTMLSIATGSITAAIASGISGLVLTIILYLMSKYYGYAKIERHGFKLKIVEYGPSLDSKSTGQLVKSVVSRSLRSLGAFAQGVRHA